MTIKLRRRDALRLASGTLLAAPLLGARPARAAGKYGPGASDTEIKIGQTMPYSGNASAYGVNGRSHAAYFRMINEQGGINGRKINFISLDDGYSPPKTVELARQLVERDQVLFLFAPLGTACNTAIHQYMNQKKVPQLFVATGASKWGNPKQFPWTMGWQPDYFTEGSIYAKHALQSVKDPKIAILRQNDDMGVDYLDGFMEGLKEVDFGDWTGHHWEGLKKHFGISAFDWLEIMGDGGIPNGESAAHLVARVKPCLQQIMAAHPHGTVAIVCHGGIIRVILSLLLELPLAKMAHFRIEYGSVSVVEIQPEKKHAVEIELLNLLPIIEVAGR